MLLSVVILEDDDDAAVGNDGGIDDYDDRDSQSVSHCSCTML